MDWLLIMNRFGGLEGWFVRVTKLNDFANTVGVELICCEFHSLPVALIELLNAKLPEVVNFVSCGRWPFSEERENEKA